MNIYIFSMRNFCLLLLKSPLNSLWVQEQPPLPSFPGQKHTGSGGIFRLPAEECRLCPGGQRGDKALCAKLHLCCHGTTIAAPSFMRPKSSSHLGEFVHCRTRAAGVTAWGSKREESNTCLWAEYAGESPKTGAPLKGVLAPWNSWGVAQPPCSPVGAGLGGEAEGAAGGRGAKGRPGGRALVPLAPSGRGHSQGWCREGNASPCPAKSPAGHLHRAGHAQC